MSVKRSSLFSVANHSISLSIFLQDSRQFSTHQITKNPQKFIVSSPLESFVPRNNRIGDENKRKTAIKSQNN